MSTSATSSMEESNNQEMNQNVNEVVQVVKKKRGRKPKSQLIEESKSSTVTSNSMTDDATEVSVQHVPKKRGRKPKGGKIVEPLDSQQLQPVFKENVILHLKCKARTQSDTMNGELPGMDYHHLNSKTYTLQYDNIDNNTLQQQHNEEYVPHHDTSHNDHQCDKSHKTNVWKKVKELQKLFYNNMLTNKSSSCFWCTCGFDTPSVHIPKSIENEKYNVYGCFCSPECGVAYLLNELIDTTQKYDRYQMMNLMYGNIFNYEHNIKPAPDPHYLLDKFYGNLTINEYRELLDSQHLIMFIDKPLTHLFPELHNEVFEQLSTKDKIITSNTTFQIKRKTKTTVSKNETMMENFGFK